MDDRIQDLAQQLVTHDMEHAFGVTGSGASLQLITALEERKVRYYPAAHEAAAAIMAGAVARLTNRPSAAISIKGPGLANLLPGIAHNYFENQPALSISECFAADVPSYRMHKRLNHAALVATLVKDTATLSELDSISRLLDTAGAEIPGPVHLELCASQRPKIDNGGRSAEHSGAEPSAAGIAQPELLLEQVRHAERPVLVVGSLALRREWRERLALLRIPIFTTAAAKGALSEGLPHSAGVFTGDGKELALETQILPAADLVIGIGLRNIEVLTPKALGHRTILLDEVGGTCADGFQADLVITDTGADLIGQVFSELELKDWGQELIRAGRERLRRALLNGAWLPAACLEALNQLDLNYMLVQDTGSFCTIGEHLWEASPQRPYLGSSNGRYMGTAIPSAIGAAIAERPRPVFCLVGDGGMRNYVAELKLAVQEQLPICFILMSDGQYGSIAGVPQKQHLSMHATTIFQPSWLEAVRGLSYETIAVESAMSFADAVQGWDCRAPLFIQATFDHDPYAEMTRQLR